MGGNGSGGNPVRQPNERLTSWFHRSGWSKGELARQVNRRARQLGAHHVSTDTSRVRRWLDGEQPREPIPRILSELFSERFGCVVSVEDLGLRMTPQAAAASGVDLPWAGGQTIDLINEFSRSDLMLGRRGFLGTSLTMAAGTSLIEPMQRWLVPAPAAPEAAPAPGVLPAAARMPGAAAAVTRAGLDQLASTTAQFRVWDAQCGGGLRRKAVVGQLHEVTELLQESAHPPAVRRRLFGVTAELADLAGWMSYDIGLQPTAQKYFVLALHAAKEAEDRPLGAYILSQMSRQMIHLGRPEDALELVHLAQYGSREQATPRTQALLYALEARAHASLGQPPRCHRAVRLAEDAFAESTPDDGDPAWLDFFTRPELCAENAHSYRDLAYVAGRSPTYVSRARPLMEEAVAGFARDSERRPHLSHQRSYALALIGMATVHLLAREPEECVRLTERALDLASRLRSERVSNRLRTTLAAVRREHGDLRAAAGLAERLTVELPEREASRAG